MTTREPMIGYLEGLTVVIPEGFRVITNLQYPHESYYWRERTRTWEPFHDLAALGVPPFRCLMIERIGADAPKSPSLTIRYTVADFLSDILKIDNELYELRGLLPTVPNIVKPCLQNRIDLIVETKREILSITLDKPEQFGKV